VTQDIVRLFESIDVDETDGELLVGFGGGFEKRVQVLAELQAVRKAREAVELGETPKLVLELLAF
jgi:hypothetical protein